MSMRERYSSNQFVLLAQKQVDFSLLAPLWLLSQTGTVDPCFCTPVNHPPSSTPDCFYSSVCLCINICIMHKHVCMYIFQGCMCVLVCAQSLPIHKDWKSQKKMMVVFPFTLSHDSFALFPVQNPPFPARI